MHKFEIFVLSILNLRHMATSKQAELHTHASCNGVPLVWGSLRLALISIQLHAVLANKKACNLIH